MYTATSVPVWGDAAWFLYDPLILADTEITLDEQYVHRTGRDIIPDLSLERIASYDLVIVAIPHVIRQQDLPEIHQYLKQGGACLLVQPTTETGEFPEIFRQHGVTCNGWSPATAPYAVITNHPSTRLLGRPSGWSVYPHRTYQPHLRLSTQTGAVLTRLGSEGDPDLITIPGARLAVSATDLFGDVEVFYRGSREYPEHRENLEYLLINTIRSLLGQPFITQPAQQSQRRWSEMFQAYAAARQFVQSMQRMAPNRLSDADLQPRLGQSDQMLQLAAQALMRGDPDGCDRLYSHATRQLTDCVTDMTAVQRFIVRGWHASLLFDKYFQGGLLGFAELEWVDLLIDWMHRQLEWINRSGATRLSDIAPNDWEIIAKYYPRDVQVFREAVQAGKIEVVHGLYTQAYLSMLSAESNIRQLTLGRAALESTLKAIPVTYLNAVDHFDFHPQMPQLLQSFGYRHVILRCGNLGYIKPVHEEKILWRGLDGTEIEAVPPYDGNGTRAAIGWPAEWLTAHEVMASDSAGYHTILLGTPASDATYDAPAEKEYTLLGNNAPVVGQWITAADYFHRTPPANQSIYYNVDDLHAQYLEKWSSIGCMNEAYGWNRDTECRLLAAEKFLALSALSHPPSAAHLSAAQDSLRDSWKKLLATQDHLSFGAVNYTIQEPPDTLSFTEQSRGKHHWGYGYGLFPPEMKTVGAVENFQEMGTENYAGPMVPINRYDIVQQYHADAQKTADAILRESLPRLLPMKSSTNGTRIPVVILNPLGWAKQDVIELEQELPRGYARTFEISDGSDTVPCQLLTSTRHDDGSLQHIKYLALPEVPPMGYQTLHVQPAALKDLKKAKSGSDLWIQQNPPRVENDYYIVELDPRQGGVRRIFDKQLKKDLLDTSLFMGNELYSRENPKASSTASEANITVVETGPVRAALRVSSHIADVPYECNISLIAGLQRVDFALTVHYGAGFPFGTNLKDGTGLCVQFPLKSREKRFINQPFGIYETKKSKQFTADFIDAVGDEFGIAVMHQNVPCCYYENGIISLALSQGRPLVVGPQTYQYALTTHRGDPVEAEVFRLSQLYNTPFHAYYPNTGKEITPPSGSFLSCEGSGVVFSTIYTEGNRVFARLYNMNDQPSRVRFYSALLRAPECREMTFSGGSLKLLTVTQGTFQRNLKPWEILTVMFDNPILPAP